jgi:hypothetical protein
MLAWHSATSGASTCSAVTAVRANRSSLSTSVPEQLAMSPTMAAMPAVDTATTHSPVSAEDVVSLTFLEAWRLRNRLLPDGEQPERDGP